MDRYLLQLMMTSGIGNAAIRKMIASAGVNNGVSFKEYCQNITLLKTVIYRTNAIDDIFAGLVGNADAACRLSEELERNNITVLTMADTGFPDGLKIRLGNDCPSVLFLKGNASLLSQKGIGFCGSRKVSERGALITAQCSKELVSNGFTVISGYAGGTDMAAHKEALLSQGNTVFVLAEGILESKIKQEVRDLLNTENHLFVSQFLPHSMWTVANAMRRNSVIIGLSEAMILVESGKKGGTFAAGEESLKRGLPLFVVDYAKPEVSAEANPYFIEKGGCPIRSRHGYPNLDAIVSLHRRVQHSYVNEQITMFQSDQTL